MTCGDAVAAMITLADRVGIVASGTIEIAALQKDDQPIARPVDA